MEYPTYTDKYFTKTRNAVDWDTVVTYGVFLRHDSICAIQLALDFLKEHASDAVIERHYKEGQLVPAERPLFSYTGKMVDLVELETQLLQRVGFCCISAYNAYRMCAVCPEISFLDMHARHAAGTDMVIYSGYGAFIGSEAAKNLGAKGFVGTSVDITAKYYGNTGLGTMPHALIGYAGSTLKAVQLFINHNPDDQMITALVDYYGQEITDSIEVAEWFVRAKKAVDMLGTKSLGVRLDTHGGRFMEGLDYDSSVEVVGNWLHKKGEWVITKHVMGDEAFEIADHSIRDRVRAILFGKGVSAAAIIHMRNTLDKAGHKDVKIVASSGFNLRKCRIMVKAHAPIDMIGTGSFLPETLPETYATCDIFAYNGKFSVKVGREDIFAPVFKPTPPGSSSDKP